MDGEPLALTHNSIHKTESPVQHAEQLAVRSANDHLRIKRPRPPSMTVEDYYRNHLFYDTGAAPADFLTRGSTLYTSLEPCPMCAATLCVARMKRIVYFVPDFTYGGSFDGRGLPSGAGIKDHYYARYELSYGQLSFANAADKSGVTTNASESYTGIVGKIGTDKTTPSTLRSRGLYDTLFFDFLNQDLEAIRRFFATLSVSDLNTTGTERQINLYTLQKLQELVGLQAQGMRSRNVDAQ